MYVFNSTIHVLQLIFNFYITIKCLNIKCGNLWITINWKDSWSLHITADIRLVAAWYKGNRILQTMNQQTGYKNNDWLSECIKCLKVLNSEKNIPVALSVAHIWTHKDLL